MNEVELEKFFLKVRRDFPILSLKVDGKRLVYVDNGATTQKPKVMVDCLSEYYLKYNSNVHRGLHFLSEKSTDLYEEVRGKVSKFVGCLEKEVVFTSGTTAGMNLVADGLVDLVEKGDEVVVSRLEHHANLVTWQEFCRRTGAVLRFLDVSENGEIDLEQVESLVCEKTKVVSVAHVSNVLGTLHPIARIGEICSKVGAFFVVDGAQSVGHMKIDFKRLNCDFFVFSAHKMFGPTGVGCVVGRFDSLSKLRPSVFGGDMICEVGFSESSFAEVPFCFEAGTPNIADVIAFGSSIDYLSGVGMKNVEKFDRVLTKYFLKFVPELERDFGFKFYGSRKVSNRSAVFSFVLEGVHSHDVCEILNSFGIAVRGGHHCAMPFTNEVLGVSATTRISLSFYNTRKEIDFVVACLKKVKTEFEKGDFLFSK